MVASAIVISQDNIISSKALLSINNPLVFLINVTYTGQVADYISVDILDVDSNVISENLIAPAYKDISITERQYIFDADQLLRGYNAQLQEWVQAVDTIELDPNSNIFTLKFYADPLDEEVTFSVLNAATQIGSSPCKDSIYDNDYQVFIAYYGFWAYTYFYNIATADLKLSPGAGGVSTDKGNGSRNTPGNF